MVDATFHGVRTLPPGTSVHSAEHSEDPASAVHWVAGLESSRALLQRPDGNVLLLRVHRLVADNRIGPFADTANVAHWCVDVPAYHREHFRADSLSRVSGDLGDHNIDVIRGLLALL